MLTQSAVVDGSTDRLRLRVPGVGPSESGNRSRRPTLIRGEIKQPRWCRPMPAAGAVPPSPSSGRTLGADDSVWKTGSLSVSRIASGIYSGRLLNLSLTGSQFLNLRILVAFRRYR